MQVKLRCRKGIPSSLRARAWQLLSNSQELLEANPGKFEVQQRDKSIGAEEKLMSFNQHVMGTVVMRPNGAFLRSRGAEAVVLSLLTDR